MGNPDVSVLIKIITLRLDIQEKERWSAKAREEGTDLANFIRGTINRYISAAGGTP